MDRIDKKIIAELQKNGRISLTELCEKVGISLSPCQRRVKQLEQDGIIRDYQANINPQAVGLNFSAIVFVVLKDGSQESIIAFENALADIPEIIQAPAVIRRARLHFAYCYHRAWRISKVV